jgi:hypothetical protein
VTACLLKHHLFMLEHIPCSLPRVHQLPRVLIHFVYMVLQDCMDGAIQV